jgi:putative endonuclease
MSFGDVCNLKTVWHIYLLECADGSLYTGITTDVGRRVAEHLSGKGARYTRSRLPVFLAASQPVGSRSQALRAELAIKRLPRGRKIEAVRSQTFTTVLERPKEKRDKGGAGNGK